MVQLSPASFKFETLGERKVGKMSAQLLHNVTEEDEVLRQGANVLLNLFQ